jgi:hypothetical protein
MGSAVEDALIKSLDKYQDTGYTKYDDLGEKILDTYQEEWLEDASTLVLKSYFCDRDLPRHISWKMPVREALVKSEGGGALVKVEGGGMLPTGKDSNLAAATAPLATYAAILMCRGHDGLNDTHMELEESEAVSEGEGAKTGLEVVPIPTRKRAAVSEGEGAKTGSEVVQIPTGKRAAVSEGEGAKTVWSWFAW